MHLVTGLILTALLGRKKNPRKSPLLNLHDVLETRHLLPGRVRFGIPVLKGNPEGAKLIMEQIPKIEGVESVAVNSITGSVLIYYREEIIEPELLFAALVRLLDLERAIERAVQPALAREIRSMGQSLNRYVYESTGGIIDLWTILPIILAGVGIHKVITQPQMRFPTGITMIWWAYHSLLHRKSEGV